MILNPLRKIILCTLFCVLPLLLAFSQYKERGKPGINQEKLISHDTIRIVMLYDSASNLFEQGKLTRSLEVAEEVIQQSKQQEYQVGIALGYLVKGQNLVRTARYDSALKLFQYAESLFEENNNIRYSAESYLEQGRVYDLLGQYKNALVQYTKAKDLSEHLYNAIRAKIFNDIGVTYLHIGNYTLALENFLQASRHVSASNEHRLSSAISNNIGAVYQELKQYKDALNYFQIFLESSKQVGNKFFTSIALYNIGETYNLLGDYEQSELHLKQAFEIQQTMGDHRGMALSNFILAELHHKKKQSRQAEQLYIASLDNAQITKNDELTLKVILGMAGFYLDLNDFQSANKNVDEALSLTKKVNSKSALAQVYLKKSLLDSARGDFRSAYHWHKRYAVLSDSLLNEKNSKQIFLLGELYENEMKDKEIIRLSELQAREAIQKANDERLYLIIAIFTVIVIISLCGWIYITTRHSSRLKIEKQKVSAANQELAKLVEKIEDKKKSLIQKNEKLKELHREKDGLIGVVAHDLRSPLNQIKGLASLMPQLGAVTPAQTQILSTIGIVCERGTNLIRDLIDINQYESEHELEIIPLPLNDFLFQVINNHSGHSREKRLWFNTSVEETTGLTFETDKTALGRILDNLVTNAIKFTPSDRSIYLETRYNCECSELSIILTDEGPGFSDSDLPHLFKKFKKLSARPTAGESSSGLGLSIVKTLVDKLNGKIAVSRGPAGGARWTLQFKLTGINAMKKEAVTFFN